jgi:undecaprenyl diphosphate synthase
MNVPKHIGIIMDGNGRWAKKRGLPRTAGHRAGTDATRKIVRACGELGVEYCTIYVFSSENWKRPPTEVSLLMKLLVEMIRKEVRDLDTNNVVLQAMGDTGRLPPQVRHELDTGIAHTASNTGLTLVLALSYGGRDEIVRAARTFAAEAASEPSCIESLDEDMFRRYLWYPGLPDPELIIRTGGEQRISNFLLWHAAYAELYFTETLWPDFDKTHLIDAIQDYNSRERRFGRV